MERFWLPHKMSDIKSVAILGVGKMGAAIAKELAVAGFEITLWNRNQEVAEKLASEINMTTVKVSPTPKSALANADLAICLFTNGIVTQSVLLDDPEVLKDVQSNLIVVDMGTSGVESARSLASALAAKEISFIDAPVSGSVATIAAHQLLVMASGDKDEIEKELNDLNKKSEVMGMIYARDCIGVNAFEKLSRLETSIHAKYIKIYDYYKLDRFGKELYEQRQVSND